jgi:hypothetical protein
MADVVLKFYRMQTERFEDEAGRKALHLQRAKLLHGLVDTVGLDVKDWGETDLEYPREVVEVMLALAPIVVPAVASVINTWLKQRNLLAFSVKQKDGTEIRISRASLRDVQALLKASASA